MSSSILVIIIAVIMIVLFIIEKIPMAITATMAAIAMGITGIIDISDIYKNFGSMPVIMVSSMMIIGDSVFQCGLARVVGSKLTLLLLPC